MQLPVALGNADEYFKETGDRWFIGHFMPPLDIRHDDNVELKWSSHKAGDQKEQFVVDNTTTVVVLFFGKLRQEYKCTEHSDKITTVVLLKCGDYVITRPGVYHRWYVEEDCQALTIRWHSSFSQGDKT